MYQRILVALENSRADQSLIPHVTALAKFCPACGANLAAVITCTHCNTRVPPGTKFCLNCGEAIAPPSS